MRHEFADDKTFYKGDDGGATQSLCPSRPPNAHRPPTSSSTPEQAGCGLIQRTRQLSEMEGQLLLTTIVSCFRKYKQLR
ncbi:unnamed protein product [Nippostrongylus brasiliensis]|uniref:Uncharacterized protein n=1 Tax=Nippostrongylus brasiliensis TaxID=27835 RepID=A0A0N4XC72_NIPBR|nr:unnamed protein product [Nippostrongylus brasiliensis]